jgi:hypothetical protein
LVERTGALSAGGRLMLLCALSCGTRLVLVLALSAALCIVPGDTRSAAPACAFGTASDWFRCVREFGAVASGELLVPV